MTMNLSDQRSPDLTQKLQGRIEELQKEAEYRKGINRDVER